MDASETDTEPTLREARDQLRDDLQLLRDAIGHRAGEVRDTVTGFVEEHPLAAVGCAFGTGFLLSGGLYSRVTSRLLRLGVRLLVGAVAREAIAAGGVELISSVVRGTGPDGPASDEGPTGPTQH
ncbi:MAG: hypothetical protein ACHQ17_02920 [Polyangia bacterium]|jgi:hypothetical protein